MSEYFPEPKSSEGRVKVELDLFSLITQQKQIQKMQQVLIYQILIKN